MKPGPTPDKLEYYFVEPHYSDLNKKKRGFKRWILADLEPGVYALGSSGRRAFTRVIQRVALPTVPRQTAINLVNTGRKAGPYSDRMGELGGLLTDFGDWASGRVGAIIADAKASDAIQWERASAMIAASSPIHAAEWLRELHPHAQASLNEDTALGLIRLEGSDKQVAWARSIRARQIRRAKGWAQLARTVFDARQAAGRLRDRHREELAAAVLDSILVHRACRHGGLPPGGQKTAKAKWWIDMLAHFGKLSDHRARDHEGEEIAGEEYYAGNFTIASAIVTGYAHAQNPTLDALISGGLTTEHEFEELKQEFGL